MTVELNRFLTLFDALFTLTNKWLEAAPEEKLDWVPFDNPHMKFGDRISAISIRSLYVHTIVGECSWSRVLRDCDDGASLMPVPDNTLTQRLLASSTLASDATALHRENLALFGSYTEEQLRKRIRWTGREWTVMGFLWGIYSHRSYHLGNIDLYLREADAPAPDFFSSFQPVLA